jgi:hypothetical protein
MIYFGDCFLLCRTLASNALSDLRVKRSSDEGLRNLTFRSGELAPPVESIGRVSAGASHGFQDRFCCRMFMLGALVVLAGEQVYVCVCGGGGAHHGCQASTATVGKGHSRLSVILKRRSARGGTRFCLAAWPCISVRNICG